jgi:ribosomal protein S18 acetylase RimI-like enzyme
VTPGIRPYLLADRQDVLDLSIRAWEPVFGSLKAALGPVIFDRLHPDWVLDQSTAVDAVLHDDDTDVWVAETEGRVVGFTAIRIDGRRKLGEIYMIAVDPSAQNEGIGSLLTNHALERCSAAGMVVAMIDTGGDPGHAPARGTYEKAGFSPLPIVRYFKALDRERPERSSSVPSA